MGTRTTEEVKFEMIEKMGIELGSLFYSLYNEITWLTIKWIEFRELFGTKVTRIELMNETAPFFFFTVQKVMWDNLLLGIARITDPPKSRGKKNITLKALGQFIEEGKLKLAFDKDVENICEESEFCRDWRNRWIAHMDYELSVNNQKAQPLELPNTEKLKAIIERIHSLYNRIEIEYLGSTTRFDFVKSDRGAISLLYKLEDGLLFDKDVYKRKVAGTWVREDFESKV